MIKTPLNIYFFVLYIFLFIHHNYKDTIILLQYFFTRNGYVLTVNFLPIRTDRNASCHMSVYDGVSSNERLLASFDLYNNTKPQSVTSTRNHIFIQFSAKAMTETLGLIKITSGLGNNVFS